MARKRLALLATLLFAAGTTLSAQTPETPQDRKPPPARDTAPKPQDQAEGIPKPAQEATAILQDALKQLAQHKTIQVNIYEKVDFAGKTFVVTGSYLKGQDDLQMSLDVRTTLAEAVPGLSGDTTSSLGLKCDGERLLVNEVVLGLPRRVTILVRDVLDVLKEKKKEDLRPVVLDLLGIGGLSQLLRGLNDTMDPKKWLRVAELEAAFQQSSSREVYVLQGQWKQPLLDSYLPPKPAGGERQASEADQPRVPTHVPTHVLLFLDRKTGIPHRIEFRHRDARRKEDQVIVLLELRDPKLNEPIDQGPFIFTPPTDAADWTDRWVDFLRLGDVSRLDDLARRGASPLSLTLPEPPENR